MRTSNDSDEKAIEQLIEAEQFEKAETLCERRIAEAAMEEQRWRRQLGFVCFLDEQNDDAYYSRAPRIFRELVSQAPESADAHFWHGYLQNIIESDTRAARKSLREAIRLDPTLPYSHLVLAGLDDETDPASELETVLRVQPGNLRAWEQLAEVRLRAGDRRGGRHALQELINATPYIETAYGIMNTYMNAVLVGSAHAERMKRDAQDQLDSM
ncbi:hypothetical protein [Gemmatimonas aurantiaca]|uniref:tetratricopeptide repeat protein n=1 Tax=Gemmatimonas aurantiaca TaxID=173480 RepID=UPI00301D41DE